MTAHMIEGWKLVALLGGVIVHMTRQRRGA